MAIDTTGLAGAVRAMREAVAQTKDESVRCAESGKMSKTYKTAEFQEYLAGRALLTALDGIPERVAALEELAARALVFSESFRYLSDNYTHCNCPRFDEDAQDSFEGALVALAALGETDGD